jgi:hypothetical protein
MADFGKSLAEGIAVKGFEAGVERLEAFVQVVAKKAFARSFGEVFGCDASELDRGFTEEAANKGARDGGKRASDGEGETGGDGVRGRPDEGRCV